MKFLLSGLKKELEAGKITLADEIYIKEKYPDYSDRLKDDPDMAMICGIIYRILLDKSAFKSELVETFNEKGEEVTVAVGGVGKMMRHCLTDVDKLTLLNVFVDSCNKSRPDAKKEVKKKRISNFLITGLFCAILASVFIGSLVKYWL